MADGRLTHLLDRQEILDCIHRYTRGVDRLDRELILSAYHPGAVDDHGVFSGTAEEFADWVVGFHTERHHGEYHYVTNHTCELDGEVAHTETYYLMVARNTAGTPLTLHGGRYLDRFEHRDGRWAIASRVSLAEWSGGLTGFDLPDPLPRVVPGVAARDRTDTSYVRPLEAVAVRPTPATP